MKPKLLVTAGTIVTSTAAIFGSLISYGMWDDVWVNQMGQTGPSYALSVLLGVISIGATLGLITMALGLIQVAVFTWRN